MRLRHPQTLDDVAGHPPAAVSLGNSNVPVDDDGLLDVSTDAEARALATAHDVDVESLQVSDAEDAEQDGCPFCDDYDGDAVPQHASQVHPDEWDDYNTEG